MEHYKYLVMEVSHSGDAMFKSSSFGGGRFCKADANVTHFGEHDSNQYWNTPEELMVPFSRWFLRKPEEEDYHMTNRIYEAYNKYRFFRVEDTFQEYEMGEANTNLTKFEITEEEFISDMFNSYAYKSIRELFDNENSVRDKRKPLELDIVISNKYQSWCWSSDYLPSDDHKNTYDITFTLPLDVNPDKVEEYISDEISLDYRFGGNDSYHEKKELENK